MRTFRARSSPPPGLYILSSRLLGKSAVLRLSDKLFDPETQNAKLLLAHRKRRLHRDDCGKSTSTDAGRFASAAAASSILLTR